MVRVVITTVAVSRLVPLLYYYAVVYCGGRDGELTERVGERRANDRVKQLSRRTTNGVRARTHGHGV